MWMAGGHRETAIQRHCFTKYSITALLSRAMNLSYKSYNERGSNARGGCNGRPTIGVEKRNQNRKMFKVDLRRFLQENGDIVGSITQLFGVTDTIR